MLTILTIYDSIMTTKQERTNPEMDFETIVDWVLKFAGVLDTMFFIAYAIGAVIDWFKNRKG